MSFSPTSSVRRKKANSKFTLIRLQIGVWTGSRAGKAVLDKRPGVQERATQAMTNAGEEVNRIMNGLNNSNDLSESTDFVPSSSSSSGSEIEGEGREKYYGESEFSNEPSSSTGSSTSRGEFLFLSFQRESVN